MANLYIISGCNGAGKTTASYTVLPEILNCREFVNADEIAKGLSPFQPETVALQAGRIMLERIDDLLKSKKDFAFETTLASRSYVNTVKVAKKLGYSVTLLYFWLASPEMAKERVKQRVERGGHNIPEETIISRYYSGIKNLFELYMPVVDGWIIVDNSETPFELIAKCENPNLEIFNILTFNLIKNTNP
jgi:predicted ABC-type ATPase